MAYWLTVLAIVVVYALIELRGIFPKGTACVPRICLNGAPRFRSQLVTPQIAIKTIRLIKDRAASAT